jgi:hypothetical protein
MLPLWFGNELFQAMLWGSVELAGGTAYWAHVGGFAFGAAAAAGIRAARIEERFIDPAIEARITHYAANPVLEEAMAAREQGDVGRALDLLQSAWQKQPDEDLALALWDAAVACAQPELGAPALAGAVRAAARRGELDLAVRHWSALSEKLPGARVDPATLLRLVPVLAGEGQRELAALALRQALDPANTQLTGGQALRVAELAKEIHPPSALRAARIALASPELHEAKRAKLEALAAELAAKGAESPEPASASESDVEPQPAPEPVEDLASEPALDVAPPFPAPDDDAIAAADAEAIDLSFDEEAAIQIPRFAAAKLREARPTRLDADALRIALDDGREGGLRFDRIQAVAVAAVAGLGPKPVLLIDLLANWNEPEAEELRGLRLRSDRFDPRNLLGCEGNTQAAFAALVERLLQASGGVALPGADAALGRPFARFASLSDYEREVFGIAG